MAQNLESICGKLDKQSPKFPYPWQKRFFKVQLKPKPGITYYQRESDATPKGCIVADKIADVVMSRKVRITISLTTSARKYYLRAPDERSAHMWHKTIRALMMNDVKGSTKKAPETKSQKIKETKENLASMDLLHKNLVACLRQASKILQSKPCFQKFAMYMEHQSYFDLGSYAPIFGNYFKAVLAFRDPNVKVNVKLDDISSVDLEKLKFDGFLDEVEKTDFLPSILAKDMEKLLTAAAQKTIEKLHRYLKEAENVNDIDVVSGLTDIADMFRCLIDD
mmetsp:Transcript_10747/g.16013  ORF Transcript_10747/g.16013 Transcript_10747/m.16013 type:complete len:279 (-) Transcript_10747:241-1077(-)